VVKYKRIHRSEVKMAIYRRIKLNLNIQDITQVKQNRILVN